MTRPVRIALVGDHDPAVIAHQAIPVALTLAAREIGVDVDARWFGTETIVDDAALDGVDGVWCVPASPYRDMGGALRAIRLARVEGRPFLGTCGGFQHAVVEFARGVLGWADADHAETAAEGARLVVTPLSCALVEVGGDVRLLPGTRLARAYGAGACHEGYHCSYGLADGVREALAEHGLRVAAVDDEGDVRAVELDGHAFFVATLFQPERRALAGAVPPVVAAFVRAAADAAGMLPAGQPGPPQSAVAPGTAS